MERGPIPLRQTLGTTPHAAQQAPLTALFEEKTLWSTSNDGVSAELNAPAAPPPDKKKGKQKRINRSLFSSASDRWYTPPDMVSEIDAFFGNDWFDPCPASDPGQPIENGLWLSWAGRKIFLNPPYGDAIAAWIRKLRSEPVAEAIALVPSRTDTRWQQPLLAEMDAICFVEGRIYFTSPEGVCDAAPFGSLLVYRGPRATEFCRAFAPRGVCWLTRRMDAAEQAEHDITVEATLWTPQHAKHVRNRRRKQQPTQ